MAFPPGMWTMRISGQYLRPDGSPQRGYVVITPVPAAIGQVPGSTAYGAIVTQQAKLDLDRNGWIRATLLNPNDPQLNPGDVTDGADVRRWSYVVQEIFFKGSVIQWTLQVPVDVGNRDCLDFAKVTRFDEKIVRPADWFPGHYANPLPRSNITPSS